MEAEKKEQDKLTRVLKGLTGITESEQPNGLQNQVSKQHVLMTGLYDPPSYFVLGEQRLQKIRGWMSSPETLKKALEAEDDELQSWLGQYQ